MRGKTRQVGYKSLMRKLLSSFPKNQVLPPKNGVVEYSRGTNVVSCGGARRKWTEFVSSKLHPFFFSCTLTLKDALRQKYLDTKFPSIVCSMFDCDIFLCILHSMFYTAQLDAPNSTVECSYMGNQSQSYSVGEKCKFKSTLWCRFRFCNFFFANQYL